MSVVVDREKCVGAGQCVLAAPDVFDQDDHDGLVSVLLRDLPSDQHDAAREAELTCPARAIELQE
jgi:ferredoxin